MIPSCDHTGTPRHFHSSTTSGSACLIKVRIRPSILPRQSPSSLILASISSEADLPCGGALFFICVSRPCCRGCDERVLASIHPCQDPLQVGKELRPPGLGAAVGLLLIRPEAHLLHAQAGPAARRGERPRDDALEAVGAPCVGQRLVRLDRQDLARDGAPVGAKIETVADGWLEVVLHEPLLD